MGKSLVSVNNRELSLSNLEKDLYPSSGFTKAQIIDYYTRMAPFILPHLKDRALTLKRYPEGVENEYFFEKRCPSYRPAWIKTAVVPYGREKYMTVCLVNDLETLTWVENLASIELHVPLCRANSPSTPDSVVFDLDPGENAGLPECAKVALALKDMLSGMKLECAVKTSGKKGLHVFVPLNSDGTTFDDTRDFSRAVAEIMQKNYPSLVTSKMAKELREKKVFINWAQNDASKTMVCVYSLRAGKAPAVSFPVGWDRLGKIAPGNFPVGPRQALELAGKSGDGFEKILEKKQRLPRL